MPDFKVGDRVLVDFGGRPHTGMVVRCYRNYCTVEVRVSGADDPVYHYADQSVLEHID
jgi:primosomal protein N'